MSILEIEPQKGCLIIMPPIYAPNSQLPSNVTIRIETQYPNFKESSLYMEWKLNGL